MKIEIRKYSSKPNMLVCTRDDGSTSWQSYGNQSDFFPYHDLTHYVVETELGIPDGFFGMITSGRSVEETASDVPDGGQIAESLAGVLSTGGTNGQITFEQVVETVNLRLAEIGVAPINLSENQYEEIRNRCDHLFGLWRELPEDDSLCLEFNCNVSVKMGAE